MAVAVLPNTITDDTAMEAAEVQANFEALRDAINNIAAAQVGTGVINASLLADGAVVAAKIGTGEVGNTKLATDAVTNAKITDGTITAAKLHSGVQVLKHMDQEETIASGGGSENYDFAGLDSTIWPTVTIYVETGTPDTYWVWTTEFSGLSLVAIQSWVGGTFRVNITNGDGSAHDVIVAVTGAAA